MTLRAAIAFSSLLTLPALALAADEPPKCSDVVAAMEEAGGSASAEQIAKKLDTSIEHVRKCWDEYDTARKAGTTK